ncbi:hypothetical protein GCM10025780_28380 [Frondihabitans cladoniiphilus]|uniref:Alpha/beta hydrolase n=1 Tax=Frondihabitans cladoniiphilus TaxID=715785 RepID=A0ABP8W4M7_9MICO
MVLAGRDEDADHYAELARHLTLNGYRVDVFSDVLREPDAIVRAVDDVLNDSAAEGPRFVIGSDAGATLAASLGTARSRRLDAVVLAGLATRGLQVATTGERVRLVPAARLLLPTLVFHGDADPVTDVADLASWAAALPRGSIRLIRGGGHDVVGGEARRSVFAALVLFLERHRAAAPVFSEAFG